MLIKTIKNILHYINADIASNQLQEALIIDGQQRITTIFIILKSLFDKAVELNGTRIENEIGKL